MRTYIQQHRPRVVLTQLLDPSHAYRSISDMAYSNSFRSDSAFSQIFKRELGLSPSELRANNTQYNLKRARIGAVDRRYEDWIRKL